MPKRPNTPATVDSSRVPFFQRTSFRLISGMFLLVLCLIASITWVMDTVGTRLVKEETSRRIEETGNRVVGQLIAHLESAETLARSLANLVPPSSKEEATLKPLVRNLLDFNGDTDIAGGGLWFEPHIFDPKLVRKSFFWGRDAQNQLQFYDDYNLPGPDYDESRLETDPNYRQAFLAAPGYQNEEWYVVVAHLREYGRGFWSRSYIDPYSFQPMVTCTVPIRDNENRFIGVSTVDLKLEGLQALTELWATEVGGYVFVLDRNNKFITFPDLARAKRVETDAKGNHSEDFLLADAFAEKEASFQPIAALVDAYNLELVERARAGTGFAMDVAKQIDLSSYQINRTEASLIAALILKQNAGQKSTNLVLQTEIEKDFRLQTPAVVSVFNVPRASWKVVIVKPTSQYTAVARNIKSQLIGYLSAIVLLLLTCASIFQFYAIARPLQSLTERFKTIGLKLQAGETIDRIDERHYKHGFKGEVGALAQVLGTMTNELAKTHEALQEESRNLELKVQERTRELKRAQAVALANAHAAGMAEMSASVLHNIGNALNTLNVEIEGLQEVLRRDHLDYYERAMKLLLEHREDLGNYFNLDPKGKVLLEYLMAFGSGFKEEQSHSHKQLELILEGLAKVNRILATQHQYAKSVNFNEDFDLVTVLEDALSLEAPSLNGSDIHVERHYRKRLAVHAPKVKIMHILINLIRNARESMSESDAAQPKHLSLTVDTTPDGMAVVVVADTGVGIPAEYLERIFNQGFTTKPDGQGMGLHFCVSAAHEMGALLSASSGGAGKGASFTLMLRGMITS